MKKQLLWDLFKNTGKIEYYMKYKECIKGMKFSTLLFSIRMNVKYPVKLFHLYCPSKIGMLFLKRIK